MLAALAHQVPLYLELTKPRINALVVVATAFGFTVAGGGDGHPWLLIRTLFGTACAAGEAAVLNHYLERDADAAMLRTRRRPLPAGTSSASRCSC